MKTNRAKILLMWLFMAAIVFLSSCSPQQRLNKLLRKHPELVKHDTTFVAKTITVPELKADTIGLINANVFAVDSLFIPFINVIDRSALPQIKTTIKDYIIGRKVLEDTIRLQLQNGGFVKVYQTGKSIKVDFFEPKKEIALRVPVSVSNVEQVNEPTLKEKFFSFINELRVFAFVLALSFFIWLFWNRKKQ